MNRPKGPRGHASGGRQLSLADAIDGVPVTRFPWPPQTLVPHNEGGASVRAVLRADVQGSDEVLVVTGYAALEEEKDRLLQAFQENQHHLQASNEALLQLAAMDGLTGIANRRLFDEVLEREWSRGIEAGQPLSLVLLDVDHFKAYNDIYGHLAGDDCLRRVASLVAETVGQCDALTARYGGEEFVVILTGRGEVEATRIADALRRAVESAAIPHRGSTHNKRVTVSIGVVTRIPTDDSSPAALIESADTCLYRAKEAGRNWIVSADLSKQQRRSRSGSPFRTPALSR
jgi:diguanylate cyclase (GGDEF)-like protein